MNLISTVVAIGLLGLLVGAGISNLNPNAQASAEAAATAAAGFQILTQAYQSRQITGAPPPDPASWQQALFPAFGDPPKPPAGASWSYGLSTSGRWFCLSTPHGASWLRTALTQVGQRYADTSYRVSGRCGDAGTPVVAPGSAKPATSTSVGGVGGADAADSMAATLWVAREGG